MKRRLDSICEPHIKNGRVQVGFDRGASKPLEKAYYEGAAALWGLILMAQAIGDRDMP